MFNIKKNVFSAIWEGEGGGGGGGGIGRKHTIIRVCVSIFFSRVSFVQHSLAHHTVIPVKRQFGGVSPCRSLY
jgi:hypothetical protein